MTTSKQEEKAWAAYHNYLDQEDKKMKVALDIVKKKVSSEFFEDIQAFIKQSDFVHSAEITSNNPYSGYYQKEDGYDCLKEVWVHQYVNGGMEGDSFAGQVWIKINEEEYLTYHYSM